MVLIVIFILNQRQQRDARSSGDQGRMVEMGATILERLNAMQADQRTLAHDTAAYHRAHERSAAERHAGVLALHEEQTEAIVSCIETVREPVKEMQKRLSA